MEEVNAEYYLFHRDELSFHQAPVADEHRDRYLEMLSDDSLNPRVCFSNAQRLALRYADDPDIEYAEGLAMPATAGIVTRHAWLCINGRATEVTWPEHARADCNATYLGLTIPADELREIRNRCFATNQQPGPLFVPDETVAEVFGQMGPLQ